MAPEATASPIAVPEPDFARWLRPGPAWWAEFERAFLAPTHEPLARRAGEAGWRPDPADAFCPRCASTVGPHEVGPILGPGSALGCTRCRDERLPWRRAVRLGPYEGALREWIHELKFERFRPAGRALGRLLGERLKAELAATGIDPARAVLAPIPMSTRRRLARGVDHTLVLARGIREVTGLRIVRWLGRRHRASQLEVSAARRKRNAAGSFYLRRAGRGWGARGSDTGPAVVILVDDVRTTGATMRAAARVLARGSGVSRGMVGAGGEGAVWMAVAGVTPGRGDEGRGKTPSAGVEA